MLGRAVGIVTAASALGASAFLIPASLSNGGADDLAITPATLNAKQQVLQLPCPECAFTSSPEESIADVEDGEEAEQEFRIQGGANSVVVNLTISEDGQSLQVNGEIIYPYGFQLDRFLSRRVYVDQVASSASIEDIESGKARTTTLEVTGSGFSIQEERVASEEGHTLVSVKYSMYEIERQPVTLDDVNIKLLKTADGELLLAHVTSEGSRPIHPEFPEIFASPQWAEDMKDEMEEDIKHTEQGFVSIMPHPPGPPQDFAGQKECSNLPATLCKLRIMVEDNLRAMRNGATRKFGCHGGKGKGFPPHVRPHFFRVGVEGEDAPRHHGRPHHNGAHGHHRYHHHAFHFMHSFARGLVAVLVPTMMGIAVGMVVSLIGLLIGRLISFLWIHFYRGGRRGYQPVHLSEDDEMIVEEDMDKRHVVVLEQSEPLPIYEEAPAYEDIEKEVK